MKSVIQHSPLSEISKPYQGILLDAYGVFWAGNAAGLLPGSALAMKSLVDSGKIVGVLSNATRLAKKEIEKLSRHGLHLGKHFHFLITSGEVARQTVLSKTLPFPTSVNRYYVLGGPYPETSVHEEIFAGSSFTETTNVHGAGFIYVSTPQISGIDQIDPSVFENHVRECVDSKLPMLCANPDLFAHEGNPPIAVVRQGSLAKRYEELGGPVHYIGKPHALVFAHAMEQFAKHDIYHPSDIVMIGDTPETDVRGAKRFGMSSVLITRTGITADRIEIMGEARLLNELSPDDHPHYFLERLQ